MFDISPFFFLQLSYYVVGKNVKLYMSEENEACVVDFQGSKRFLEDHLDASDSPLLSETHFTLCLDTVGTGDTLRLHVSKRPRENSPGHRFYQVSLCS